MARALYDRRQQSGAGRSFAARAISLGQGATAKSGLVIPVDVQIGSTKGQRAGIYRDVITVAINPGP